MIETRNHGPLVSSSTYWQTEQAAAGYYYLTPNAGTFRLLIPHSKSADAAEMRTAKEIVITIGTVAALIAQMPMGAIGREMTEILFDDRTDNPFALFLSLEQWERLPGEDDYKLFYEFTAWEDRRGIPHKIISRPCYLRRADLPCLKPWPKA